MTRLLLLRLLLAVGVLWAAYTITFLILYAIPGDPVTAMAADGMDSGSVSEEDLAALRAEYGFDQPLPVQYFQHLGAALTGDLGTSVQTGRPVAEAVLEVLPSTLRLASAAMVFAVAVGAAVALLAAWTRRPVLRELLLAIPPVAVSLPTFWVGLLLIQVFSFSLGLFPALGDDGWTSLVLPTVTLGLPVSAMVAQVLIRSLTEISQEAFVETAYASGQTRTRVLLTQMLRNAALPTLTMCGLIVGNLLAGSVIVETVFARPGVGLLTVQSVSMQDLPVVQGVVLFGAATFVLVNLLVDLTLPLADPRVSIDSSTR